MSLPTRLRDVFRRAAASPHTDTAPIWAELFGIERLEQHAASLATAQTVMAKPTTDRRLGDRLRDNELALRASYHAVILAVRDERAITPAADWLVDNFHVVEEQIRAIRTDLPPDYYRELPKLSDGPLAGYPRVFGLAWAFVAHTDSHFDPAMLRRFVRAYQQVQPLSIGELWAVPITLRVVLVENLRRLGEDIANHQTARQAANLLADRLLGAGTHPAEPADQVLARDEQPLHTAFAAQLVQRLREQDPRVVPGLVWLDQRLAAQGTSADAAVHEEQRLQGAVNVTIRNVITSMRLMSAIDWRQVFESISLVDEVLRAGSDFAALDFPTRDQYRRAIEELARGSRHSENEVTALLLDAVQPAEDGAETLDDVERARRLDPGYCLIGKGRAQFERTLGYRITFKGWLARANAKVGISFYIAIVAAVTMLTILGMLSVDLDRDGKQTLWLLALLAMVPASDAALALVNGGAVKRFEAVRLPGLALREGVPSSLRTIIVMPTLLTSQADIAEQIKRLEVHHLGNEDGDLCFALLTDWTDAATEHREDDDELLAAAAAAIAQLNRRYGPAPGPEHGGDRFFLLHRRRQWNASLQKWIGWERKRGKLHELNRLLRGATDTSFMAIGDHPPFVPPFVRYVIVLDADTRLPRGAAKRLIGKMAHPLNRPCFDRVAGRVITGYAILQPRVTPAMPTGRDGSLFQRIFSSSSGMDPYAAAVSDIYQDLFGEGSYCGKGIYDVDMFEAALAGRIPENTLLSHDLFEGIFARAGLVSDIEVIDDFPARYDVSVARQHRWARGDWQLLPWILGRGPHGGPRDKNVAAIPLLGRWKMFDNLHRSLSAPAALVALVGGWLLPISSPFWWSLFIVATIAMPSMVPFLTGLLPRRRGPGLATHMRVLGRHLKLALAQILLLVAFLPYHAWKMADAILRTLFRLTLSRRNLLEWVSAAQAARAPPLDWVGFYRQMAGAVALAIGAGAVVIWAAPRAWPVAAPFVLLWLMAPVIAHWISKPAPGSIIPLVTEAEAQSLRMVARRTWRFFETFVTAADNMLPPDNFQEDPAPVVAHRTSPTNLGLYLLSVVAARDFGWIGTVETVERLEATLQSMNLLERFRGHFYNWYDTSDLRPLEPRYISTVDSGNLAGQLIAVWNFCDEMLRGPINHPQWCRGIQDALELVREAMVAAPESPSSPLAGRLDDAIERLAVKLRQAPLAPAAMIVRLKHLALEAGSVADLARELRAERPGRAGVEALNWAEAARAAIDSHQRDLDSIMPWAGILDLGAELAELVSAVPSLTDLPQLCGSAMSALAQQQTQPVLETLLDGFKRSIVAAAALETRIRTVGALARQMFGAMAFDFLFDSERELLAIGYRIADGSLDPSYYDLLASEARLASFVAIAKGDVPTRHWFRLGRGLVEAGNGPALISWSGSMFEYLMPSLVMRAPAGSVLERTNRQIVREQMIYGAARGVPWGTSESAYNARDLEFTYQYRSFGLPDLALKRGLGDSTVIAPYATALAAMVEPGLAARNFARMAAIGGRGRYGWYEALDFTKSRVPEGKQVAVVRAYMAHHQGMTVVAIADALHDGAMRARFHAEPIIQATELLLQEAMPYEVAPSEPKTEIVAETESVAEVTTSTQRRFSSPFAATPRTQLLSNGRYSVMITAAGSGYSRWRDIAITRWREDATRDHWGAYIFLRDIRSGELWSAGYQPAGATPDRYDVTFSEGRAEIIRSDGTLTTTLEVAVSSEDDGEVRRVSIANRGLQARQIEVSSYAELVLAPQRADDAHATFSKLFVETEFVADAGILLATRRKRSGDEAEIWAAHLVVVEGETQGGLQFETDRARFLGRGREIATASAVTQGSTLSGTVGTVLDPIFSLRRTLRVSARSTVRIAFWTLVAASRQAVLDLADKHRNAIAFDRAATLAWTQAQVELRHLGIGASEAHLFQNLANRVLYAEPSLRPASDALKRGSGPASALWSQGISGDLPIILLRLDQSSDLEIVRQLLLAQEYWRMKQLAVDLVIVNEEPASYLQDFQNSLEELVRTDRARPRPADEGSAGGVFVLRADLVSLELRGLLASVARAVLVGHRGSLADQVRRAPERTLPPPPAKRTAAARPAYLAPPPLRLEFFNGLGGFGSGGREYVVTLAPGKTTPTPWINVVSNPAFGFLSSADGSGTTWSLDSQQNHITPWSNDPVADAPGEVFYVRDDETGELWGPTALPIREDGTGYVARHGQGYSRFEHSSHGITLELLQYVPVDDPIKISRLKITETAGRPRRLSVTAYVEWVLGPTRAAGAPFIVTEIGEMATDGRRGALLARNPWNSEFGGRVAFADLAGRQQSWTGDRTEFLGRNGTLDQPAALAGGRALSNQAGAGFDPCGALQTKLELKANGSTEEVFFLGETASAAAAQELVAKYRMLDLDQVLGAVTAQWDATLGAVTVTTPDRAMDILLNRWLLYQTLACRVWARAGFYQASGAYGFRDQLQDGMALCFARPEATREHLLRAAGRQFREGDVQHWWLPESGRGIRTRISDDRIWLSFAAGHYARTTGDFAVLDEMVPFLEGPVLREGEQESFFQPTLSDEQASLFEHCARGLDQSLAVGVHGVPLIGTGDWNDGMNRVGAGGKGESIWLGWFLHAALTEFAPVAAARGEVARAKAWLEHAAGLIVALERDGWDGGWYRRAYYDDGTPLGSAASDECRIDQIAQSWGVISGAADPARAATAMAAVERELIAPGDQLALLFTPPFDQTRLDPGYIKGYPPGTRENGGQYTHAAVWSVIALALQGSGDKAFALFSMLNPINHARSQDEVARYKVEPYVVCADIYAAPLHVGRGGWSWYTGSAGWMYRAGLESILGFRKEGTELVLDPCIPAIWPGFEIRFRYLSAYYDIKVENPRGVQQGVVRAELDGVPLPGNLARIPLSDDGTTHRVLVVLG